MKRTDIQDSFCKSIFKNDQDAAITKQFTQKWIELMRIQGGDEEHESSDLLPLIRRRQE